LREEEIFSLINHRLEQARTALDDAQYLLEGNRSPQSIVNRSFYAMFYATLALLQKIGKIPSKHSGVISLFDTEFVLKGTFPKELSKSFHKAFELRQVSDYQNTESVSMGEAQDALQRAVIFVNAIAEYLTAEKQDSDK
jgi:uncharacterized protein (UPF0332 family)